MSSGPSAADLSDSAFPSRESRARNNADSVRVGVIGYGYWGPNIVRNFRALDRCEVISVCDRNAKALKRAQKTYPALHLTTDFTEVLASPDIDAVAIVTPVWTHFELAKKALENGKHVFVEKPFTSTSAQATQLIELACKKNLRIMVDHTFLFNGAVPRSSPRGAPGWKQKDRHNGGGDATTCQASSLGNAPILGRKPAPA